MTRVIDADGHVLEPADLWERYIDPEFRDGCPALLHTDDGSELLRIEGDRIVDYRKSGSIAQGAELQPWRFGNSGAFGAGRRMTSAELAQLNNLPYESGRPGGFDPHARVVDMDAEGIDVAFLYPTIGLFLGAIADPDRAAAASRAYNRWLAEYCSLYPDRLFGVAMLPLQSADRAVSELRYAAEQLGMRAAFIPPTPTPLGRIHDEPLTPIWENAQELGVAIGVHGGSGQLAGQIAVDRFTDGKAVRHLMSHTLEMIAAATSFIMCGVCDRFPNLHVGFLEAGGGWMAGLLDRMDRHFDDPSMNDTGLHTRPSEIFRRQCFISFEPVEASLRELANYLGPTNILWATDYPHADGFPDAPALIRKLGMPADIEAQVLGAGAERFYRLPV
jgi:predicted TIM-barrel fold metal-dependent hydrolase